MLPVLETTKTGSGVEVSVALIVRWARKTFASWRPKGRNFAAMALKARASSSSSSCDSTGASRSRAPSPAPRRSGQDSDRRSSERLSRYRDRAKGAPRPPSRSARASPLSGSPAGTGQFCLHDVVIELRQVFPRAFSVVKQAVAVARSTAWRDCGPTLRKTASASAWARKESSTASTHRARGRASRRHRLVREDSRKRARWAIELPGGGGSPDCAW